MNSVYLNCCRLCASSAENSVPIFEEDGISNFAEKIKTYLHVEITNSSNSNDVPRMCSSCSEKIINWDQYAEQVHKVQGMFMSLATAENHTELLKKLNKELTAENDEIENDIDNDYEDDDDGGCVEMDGKNYPEYSPPTDMCSSEEKLYENGRGKRKGKQKKNKKKKKGMASVDNNDDFSEEDDLPLALQMDCTSDALKQRLGNVKESDEDNYEDGQRQTVQRITLKIKATKDRPPEVITGKEADNGLGGGDDDDEDDEGDDSNSGFKEDNKGNTSVDQSLFTWECLECQEPVKNWNALVKHCREKHDSNAAVLCICGKQLQSRASIMKHRMKHTVGYGYKCDYENCNKTFHKQQLLDVHMLSHMPKEMQPWMCCKCSRRFHTESLLKQHEKVHLPKEEKLIHPCEVCQKRFCSKSAVAAHIRAVHFGERPFVCDQCGHSFTSKGILHEHLTIHSDVYNFHCKDCNKSFKTKYRLKIHMDTHVETRYQCPICTLTLNTRRTLRMHLLVHRDDKAFQCTTCGKAFKRSKDLKNHYNLHTGRRPYTCPFCLRTFANGSNCRSHKRRMHPEELKMYEAAIAAGQQPVILRAEEDTSQIVNGSNPEEQVNGKDEFLDESNDSNSEVSEMTHKYSDEEEKPVPLVADDGVKFQRIEATVIDQDFQNVEKYKFINSNSAPLNLQRNCLKKIKEEDEEDMVQTFAMGNEENVTANIAQIAFGNQGQTLHYPIHNLYTFQSSGIPAFPGNPFFRQ